MTPHAIRFFVDDHAVRHVGEGLLARTLSRPEWTHEAHLAAVAYILIERPEIDLTTEIATIIAGFNAAVGGVNDDSAGYHHTISLAYLAGIRRFLRQVSTGTLAAQVNALLASPVGERDWALRFYSRDRLFSVAARRGFVAPDLAPLP